MGGAKSGSLRRGCLTRDVTNERNEVECRFNRCCLSIETNPFLIFFSFLFLFLFLFLFSYTYTNIAKYLLLFYKNITVRWWSEDTHVRYMSIQIVGATARRESSSFAGVFPTS